MLKVFVDTDTEFRNEQCKKYGFELISMPYTLEGKEYFPYKDGDDFDYKGYYDKLRSGVLPSTAALSQDSYVEYFEPCFKAGHDVLYVHFSSAMSASFGYMDLAVKELLEKYPDRKFYQIDTLAITIGSYVIIDELGQMYKNGATAEEMLAWADKEVQHFACYFFADDLKFFSKSGRVSGLAGFFGKLIGIRPIIYINGEGKMVSIDKVKGRAKAISYLSNKVAELGLDVEKHKIVIGHCDAMELVDELKEELLQVFPKAQIEVVDVNPTIGGHCGPDTVGVAFHSVSR